MREAGPGGFRRKLAVAVAVGWLGWVAGASGAEPPMPSAAQSPIAIFRNLLALSPEKRSEAMAGRTEAQRRVIAAKLDEYAALPEEEREARLRATEFQWYLRPLLAAGPSTRASQLAAVPLEYRAALESRLEQWDQLPADSRREVLENEPMIHSFLRLSNGTPAQREAFLRGLTPELRAKLEGELRRWQETPAEKRREMTRRFQQFFELPPGEQTRTLAALSEEERREMEVTLSRFRALPPAQRVVCVESFSRFTELPPADRLEFLRSAERWREMSASERARWRALVTRFPPLPPGFGGPPMPPRQLPVAVPGSATAGLTNAGQ